MTKKDDIMFDKREELAEEHPFLRTELGQYAFQLGFDTAAESMVEKACDWIEENIDTYLYINRDWNAPQLNYEFFKDFKKAILEE